MKTYQIHFIRHGQTSENKRGAYVGSRDIPLSPEGIDALKKINKEFDYPGTPIVYSSPMLRCIQTCNILYPAMKPVVVNDLRECSFGEWEGKTAEELKMDKAFPYWLANSQLTPPPGGESGADFTKRVCLAFENIVNSMLKSGETVAVIVAHGGVISTLMSVYGLPHASPYDWYCDNGFGFSLRVNTMLWMRDKVCEVYGKIPTPLKEHDE